MRVQRTLRGRILVLWYDTPSSSSGNLPRYTSLGVRESVVGPSCGVYTFSVDLYLGGRGLFGELDFSTPRVFPRGCLARVLRLSVCFILLR